MLTQRAFEPQVSDYVPTQPAFQPQTSDYTPINTSASAFAEPDIALRPQDFTALENPVSHARHYTEQELREIDSSPTEEVVAFFNDIGGSSRLHTYTDEETGITYTSTVYSSPLLDNKEFYVTDRGRSYWQTGNEGLIVDGEVIVHPTSIAAKSLPLTDTEIQTVLAAQQGLPLEEPQYESAQNTAFGQDSNLFDEFSPANPDNLPTELMRENIHNLVIRNPPVANPPAVQPTDRPSEQTAAVDTIASTAQSSEPLPHPEETATSLAGDTASQISTATDLLAKPLEEWAQVLQRTAELKSELAATYANGMITFQNGEMPADAAGFFARNPGALNETVVTIREQAENIRKMAGEDAGKAYFFGAMGKLAGGVGNGLDVMELGIRMNKAYHEDTQSNWDSVYGQLSKIMVGAAGGAAAVGTARLAGLIAVGMGAPTLGVLVASIGVGVLTTYLISETADFIESEISKGNTILSAPVDDVTDLVLVGDMHLPIDARLRADNVVVFGNQRFDNIEIEADKVEIVGGISSEGNFIVHAEEVSVTASENVAQTLLEKAQAEAVAAARNGTDSTVQTEQVADVPAEAAESVPAELPIAENKKVIGYDSPENILPDGSRIDDEMFLYYENQENLLSQPVTEIPVPANESVAYPDTVTPDIGMHDIYDDYILY